MTKRLITLNILVFITFYSFAQSGYDRYLKQGIEFYDKKDYLTALERFDLAYELARTKIKKTESRDWKNKSKNGIKRQAKDLQDASRMKKEALEMSDKAKEAEKKALMAEREAQKQKALARLKEFELSKTLKAIYFYKDQYTLAFKDSLFGYIDREGNIKINYKYRSAGSFDHLGFARVKKGRKYYLVDTQGDEYLLSVNLKNINQNTKAVDLRGWGIARFPKSLLKNSQIEILFLAENQLNKLPKKISKLTNLKIIELEGNRIEKNTIENLKKTLPDCTIIY